MNTKDWGTVESQLSNVRDAVKILATDLGPPPKLAEVRERGRALDVLGDIERNLANVKRWLDGKV